MMQLGNLKEVFLHVSPLIEIENTIIYEIKYLQSKLEIMSITFIIILLEHGRNVIKQIKYMKNILSTLDSYQHIVASMVPSYI